MPENMPEDENYLNKKQTVWNSNSRGMYYELNPPLQIRVRGKNGAESINTSKIELIAECATFQDDGAVYITLNDKKYMLLQTQNIQKIKNYFLNLDEKIRHRKKNLSVRAIEKSD